MPTTPEQRSAAMLDLMVKVRMGDDDALNRITRIIVVAYQIGHEWREQDGINGHLLDQLADATAEITHG